MHHAIAELLSAPWAILPERLAFVTALLRPAGGQSARSDPAPQARIHARASVARHTQAGHGAIAVLPFHGVAVQRTDELGEALGLLSLARFAQSFRAALADDSVDGILLDVDSPGASVYGVMELADEVYRARGRKPVFAVANSLAASGAYWIGSAASDFYVTPGGEVGSIGVVAAHLDVSQALERAGIKTTLVSAGKYKTEGHPAVPLGSDARRHVQARVDAYYNAFVCSVARNRGVDYKKQHSFPGGATVQAHTEFWVAAIKRQLVKFIVGVLIITCHPFAMGGDLVLLQQAQVQLPPWDTRHYLNIADAGPSSKGGLLIAGRQGDSRSWTFYVSGAMHLQWSKIIDQGWPGYQAVAIADSRDGGFWVAGYGQSTDTQAEVNKNRENWRKIQDAVAFDYVSRLDQAGRQLWQRPFFTGARRWIYCVKEGNDGLFVSGDESLPAIIDDGKASETSVNVPWVAKLDKQGNVLWERRVAGKDDSALVSASWPIPTCTALEPGDDGGVTLAAVVGQIEGARRDLDGLHVPAQYDKHTASKGTLVAKFDGAGNDLHAIKLDAATVDKTYLFATSRGFSVVDHIRPKGDPKQVKSILDIIPALRELTSRSGVRITDLNSDLDKVDEQSITIPVLFDRLSAVFPLRAGGYFMGGCDVDSKNSIVWITQSGSVGATLRMDPEVGLSRCAHMALGRAESDGVYMLFTDAPSGYIVSRFRGPTQ